MIGFISAGFNPPQSLTKEEMSFLRVSDTIIVDTYTSPNYLRSFEGRELTFASRERMEDFEWILRLKGNVSIVIPGDSFSATTHFSIYQQAVKEGVEIKVFHNASIFPVAATRLGLHLYKVGPAVSLPRFKGRFRPVSPYDKILENFRRGLHTIVLLDTEPPMRLSDALDELQWMEAERNEGLFRDETSVGVLSGLGMPNEKIAFGNMSTLKKWNEGDVPFTIVVPGELHFQEKEALELFRVRL